MKNMRLLIVCLIFLAAPPASPGTVQAAGRELIVSAAMSLSTAFTDMVSGFTAEHPGCRVILNCASSGDLARQIAAGAPVDVYASASQAFMDMLDKNDVLLPESRTDFAGNTIVLIVPAHAAAEPAGFAALLQRHVKKIALGNAGTVPAGRYAEECLRYYDLLEQLRPKFVLGEHVRQVLDYVARAEVDAGIVYATDALERDSEVRIIAQAPPESHAPVRYPVAVIRGSRQPDLAAAFVAFIVACDKGQRILMNCGFLPVHSH